MLILVLVIAFFALTLGDQRVIAYTTQASSSSDVHVNQQAGGIDYHNKIALFDDSVVHSIQILMDSEEYDTMISTYQQTGLKEYFHADILIDGVRVNEVGIRLKGNASLRTALGGGMEGDRGGNFPGNQVAPATTPGAEGDIPQLPEGFQPPAGFPAEGERHGFPLGGNPPELPEGFQPPANGMAPGNFFQGGMGRAAQGEVKIPFLIKFDEFVDGQTYQDHTRLALRTYGITYDEAMLEEPVTNAVFAIMGLPATETAYTGLSINDEAERLYVISEVVDDPVYLARNFSNANGVLYKAEVGSSLTFISDDPSSYARSFSQETRLNDADLAPLVEFMRFLTESDEATFESELPHYLDVDAFASYLAITNLLVNLDSIAGMNNNYYLYYDDVADRFTLLYWDGNESLGGLGMSTSAGFDLYFEGQQMMRSPGGSANILLERFLANQTFKALYEKKLQQVFEQVFTSGAIFDQVETYSALIRRASRSVNAERSLVDLSAYEQSVQAVVDFLTQRLDYLQSSELLGQ
jgi:spore coat protein CotH